MNILFLNCRGLGEPRHVRILRNLLHKQEASLAFLWETKLLRKQTEFVRKECGFQSMFSVDRTGSSGGITLLWKDHLTVSLLTFSKYFIWSDCARSWREKTVAPHWDIWRARTWKTPRILEYSCIEREKRIALVLWRWSEWNHVSIRKVGQQPKIRSFDEELKWLHEFIWSVRYGFEGPK